jgi:hypothetical protein
MKLITKQDIINVAPARWHSAYFIPDSGWAYLPKIDTGAVYRRLMALPELTERAINGVIGNGTWTEIRCDSCHKSVESVVNLDVTHGEYTTYICPNCLRVALELVEKETI